MAGRPRPVTRKLGGLTPIQLAAQQRGKGNAFEQLTAGLYHPKPYRDVATGRRVMPSSKPLNGLPSPVAAKSFYKPISVKPLKDFKLSSSDAHWKAFTKVVLHQPLSAQDRKLWHSDIAPELAPYKQAADIINKKNPKERADFVEMLAADVKDPNIAKTLKDFGAVRKKSWQAAHPKKNWYDHATDWLKGAAHDSAKFLTDAVAGGVVASAPATLGGSNRRVMKATTGVDPNAALDPRVRDDLTKSLKNNIKSGGLEVLHQYARVPHAVSGYVNAEISAIKKGKPFYAVQKAGMHGGYEGLVKNKPVGGGQILNNLGVHNKAIAGIGGFIWDVPTDPLTWVSGGTARVARTAGEGAARKVATDAGVRASYETAQSAARQAADRALWREAQKVLRGADARIKKKVANVRREHINNPNKTPLTNVELAQLEKSLRDKVAVPSYVERDVKAALSELAKTRPVSEVDKKLITGRITAQAILPAKRVREIVEREYQVYGVGDIRHVTPGVSKRAVKKGFYDAPLARTAASRAERVAYARGAKILYAGRTVGRTRRDPLGINYGAREALILPKGKVIPADRAYPIVLGQSLNLGRKARTEKVPFEKIVAGENLPRQGGVTATARGELRKFGVSKNATIRPSSVSSRLSWEQMKYLRAGYEADRNRVRRIADFVSKQYGQRVKIRDNPDFVQVLEHQIVGGKHPLPEHLRDVGKRVSNLSAAKQREAFTTARVGVVNPPKQGSGLTAESLFNSRMRELKRAGWTKFELNTVRALREKQSHLDGLEELLGKRATYKKHSKLIDAVAKSNLSSKKLKQVSLAFIHKNEDNVAGPWKADVVQGLKTINQNDELKALWGLDRESALRVLDFATSRKLLEEHPEWAASNGMKSQGLIEATRLRLASERKKLYRSGTFLNERQNYFPHIDLEHYNRAFHDSIMTRRLRLGKGKPIVQAGRLTSDEEKLASKVPWKDSSHANPLAKIDPHRFGGGNANSSNDLADSLLAPREINLSAVEINRSIERLRAEFEKPDYLGVSVNVPKAINGYMRAVGYRGARLRYQERVLNTMGKAVYRANTFDRPRGTEERPLLSARVEAKVRAVMDGHAEDMQNYVAAQAAFKVDPSEENALRLAETKAIANNYEINGLGLPVKTLTKREAEKHFYRIAKDHLAADQQSVKWIENVALPFVEAAAKMQRDLLGMRGSLNKAGLGVSKQGKVVMDEIQRQSLRAINELDKAMIKISDETADLMKGSQVDPLAEFRSRAHPVSEMMRPWLEEKFAVDFAFLDQMMSGRIYKGDVFKQAQTLALYDEIARKFLFEYVDPISHLAFGNGSVESSLFNGASRELMMELGPRLGHPAFKVKADSGESVWNVLQNYDFNSVAKKLKDFKSELTDTQSNLNWTRRGDLYPGDAIAFVIREAQQRLGRKLTEDDLTTVTELKNVVGSSVMVHKDLNGNINLLKGDQIVNVINDQMRVKRVFEPRGSAADRANVTKHYQKAKGELKSALDKEDRFRASLEKQGNVGSDLYETVFRYQVKKMTEMREARYGRPLSPSEKMVVRDDVGEYLASSSVESWPLPPQIAKQYYRLQRDLGQAQVKFDAIERTHKLLHENVWKSELRSPFITRPKNEKLVSAGEGKDMKLVNTGGLGGGQVYVMDNSAYKALLEDVLPFEEAGYKMRWWSEALGTWKWLVTQAVPAFWVRNFFGDMQNSILAQGGVSYAAQFRNALRVARYIKMLERHEREINPGALSNKKLEDLGARWVNLNDNTPSGIVRRSRQLFTGGDLTGGGASVEQIARWALEDGVANAGLTARDIAETVHHAGDVFNPSIGSSRYFRGIRASRANEREMKLLEKNYGSKQKSDSSIDYAFGRISPMSKIEDFSNLRENFAGRINTYMGTLGQSGGSRRMAASAATRHHFDYGNLTKFEQTVRNNFMPFYTWNARNLPLWAAALWERPGMIANFEMAREEAAYASGIDPNYEGKLSLTEQNVFPFPINLPQNLPFGLGGMNTASLGSGGTSISSINYGPGAAVLGAFNAFGIGDVAYFMAAKDYVLGLLNPAIKVPIEITTGYSFYLHGQIVPPNHELTQAPGWTKVLKDMPAFQSLTGWVPSYWDKNGQSKKIPGWSTKMDYLASQAPGAFGLLMRLDKQASKNPLSYVDPVRSGLSFVTGLRLRKYDPMANEYRALLQFRAELEKERSRWRQRTDNQGNQINAANANKRYTELTDWIDRTKEAISAHEDYFGIPNTSGLSKSTQSASGSGNYYGSSSGNYYGSGSYYGYGSGNYYGSNGGNYYGN